MPNRRLQSIPQWITLEGVVTPAIVLHAGDAHLAVDFHGEDSPARDFDRRHPGAADRPPLRHRVALPARCGLRQGQCVSMCEFNAIDMRRLPLVTRRKRGSLGEILAEKIFR